ncbi:MAG: NfeD family protein [Candidatus Kapaibacterium sp.]|jgi:membrane protein implicated in regulation of membrane protease activity
MNYYWWGIAAIVFFLLEYPTRGFVLVWFGVGAIVAGLADMLGVNSLEWQALIFLGVSGVLVALTRKLTHKMHPKTPAVRTNMDALMNQIGIVTEAIHNDYGSGRITVLGQDWMARSDGQHEIGVGTKVHVKRFEGAKLIVSQM